jgi:hypothetical protein
MVKDTLIILLLEARYFSTEGIRFAHPEEFGEKCL